MQLTLFKKIKDFIRRGRRGYCPENLWNLNHFYCEMFVKTLTAFLGEGGPISHPGYMSYEQWISTIQEMINCFQFQIDHADDDNLDGEKNKHLERGFYLLKKHFWHLWD